MKIIKIIKEKYKILIPLMVFAVLLVTIFFLYREYKYDNTRNKKEIPVFQYFGGKRYDYTAIVTYNLKDSIVDLSAKNMKIDYNSVPLYYQNEDKVIFPKMMTIAFPLREGSQFRLYQYSTYYREDDVHYIKNNVDVSKYNYFFLYDGKNLFFFPYDVELHINGKKYADLGSMSYVYIKGTTLKYYDYATDKSEVMEVRGKNVDIVSEYINVDITGRAFTSFNDSVLLFKPDNLNPVFKTIDK